MAKGKPGKTFFEVYGSQSHKGSEVPVSGKAGKEKIIEDFPVFEGEDLIVISDIAEMPPAMGGGSGKGKVVAIIIGAACGVGLAIGMFFLGHSLGRGSRPPSGEITVKTPGKATAPKVIQESGGPERPKIVEKQERREKQVAKAPVPPVAPLPATTDTWTLRIISYSDVQKNLERAAAVADFLQNATGHDAFVARLGNKLVVCLGEFSSKRSPDLLELQKQVRAFEYENRKQFITSYPVRLK